MKLKKKKKKCFYHYNVSSDFQHFPCLSPFLSFNFAVKYFLVILLLLLTCGWLWFSFYFHVFFRYDFACFFYIYISICRSISVCLSVLCMRVCIHVCGFMCMCECMWMWIYWFQEVPSQWHLKEIWIDCWYIFFFTKY